MQKTITIDVTDEVYDRGYVDGLEAKVASSNFILFWLGVICGVVLTFLIKYSELLCS